MKYYIRLLQASLILCGVFAAGAASATVINVAQVTQAV